MNEIFEDDLIDFLDEKYETPAESHITFLFQNEESSYNFDEEIESIIHNQEPSFQEQLFNIIREKHLSEVDVYTKANLTRQHFSKIRSDLMYQPTKMTVISLSFAMKLSYDETMDLLKRAGLTLSHSNKKDLIVEYFLCHNIYDIFLLSEKIEKYGE